MKWLIWIKLILGLWVILSPWILDFSGINLAMWSNLIAGALIIVFSLWGLFGKKSEETPQ